METDWSPRTEEAPGVPGVPLVSIVVISYNYAEFLQEAIDSALAQNTAVEVLVVDDGSTDESRDIIESFGSRVRSIFKEKGRNSSVVNVAVPAVNGQVVMFLDADDRLYPGAAAAVASFWRAGCAKVQFRLTLIDAAGQSIGVDPPSDVVMSTGDVLPQVVKAGVM